MEDRDERARGRGACLLQRGGKRRESHEKRCMDEENGGWFRSISKTPLTYLVVIMYGLIM